MGRGELHGHTVILDRSDVAYALLRAVCALMRKRLMKARSHEHQATPSGAVSSARNPLRSCHRARCISLEVFVATRLWCARRWRSRVSREYERGRHESAYATKEHVQSVARMLPMHMFVPISFERFVAQYLKRNPDENGRLFRQSLEEAVRAKRAGEVVHLGNPSGPSAVRL
jgi:hypothetical protein